ncbi:MAG: hypothetical protein ABI777_03130 [Betaproteobacteria bacterium]
MPLTATRRGALSVLIRRYNRAMLQSCLDIVAAVTLTARVALLHPAALAP